MQTPQPIARHLALACAGIALVAFTFSAQAQDWETILDLQDPAGGSAQGKSLLVDPLSNEMAPSRIYVGGIIGLQASLLVFDQSTNGYFQQDVPDAFRVNRIGYDPASRSRFAVCSSYSVPNGRWQVDQQTLGTTNWHLADTFLLTTNQGAAANGFAADDQGNLFISGVATDNSGQTHWIVRKSGDRGQTWRTVDDYPNAAAAKMHYLPGTNGGLFVVGSRNGGTTWAVRRSRDSGTTWSLVDSLAGIAYGISSDSAANLYVAGRTSGWTVRQSTNGGSTWRTIYSSSSTGYGAYDIAADSKGNLWVTGSYDLGWAVLRRDPAGMWQPLEFLGPTGGSSGINLSSGEAIAVDRAGDVFVTGYIRDDPTLPFRWVTFKRLSETPFLKATVFVQNTILSWPASYQGFVLQSATTLVNGGDWQDSDATPTIVGDQKAVNVRTTNSTGFFRLRK